MSRQELIAQVIGLNGKVLPRGMRGFAFFLVGCGIVGLFLGGLGGGENVIWTSVLTTTVLIIGVAVVGPLLSAIFEMTGAKWGRAYRRLAEASVALMPLGMIGLALCLIGGSAYLPWVHEHPHVGGKAIWLTRGFWDLRVILSLCAAYGVGFAFVRLSIRRDFCSNEVRGQYGGPLGKWFAKGIENPELEARKCSKKMILLAPVVAIVYAVAFSLLGFDLIMALEPDWFSTLFGAWYFVGNIFFGLALLAIVTVALSRKVELGSFITKNRQADMATLLLAFCLLNVDFFWNQYLTIWYANLPEETFYLIERTVDTSKSWRSLSFVSLATFFTIPFIALLIRRVKESGPLLTIVSLLSVVGIFLARFIEIAPAILSCGAEGEGCGLFLTMLATGLTFAGFLGCGLWLYGRFLSSVPIMPVGDDVFLREQGVLEGHS